MAKDWHSPRQRLSTPRHTDRPIGKNETRSTCGGSRWRWDSRCQRCRWRCAALGVYRSTWKEPTWKQGNAAGSIDSCLPNSTLRLDRRAGPRGSQQRVDHLAVVDDLDGPTLGRVELLL